MLNPPAPIPADQPAASDRGPASRDDHDHATRERTHRHCEPAESGDRTPVIIQAALVQPHPIPWLWPGRIAIGRLTLLVGPPSMGKSLVALDIAARVTTGRSWPDNAPSALPAGKVLLVNPLDNPADTLRPRLDAAGADPARVNILTAVTGEDKLGKYHRPLYLPRDVELLRAQIFGMPDCRLVVIDPTSACLGPAPRRPADIRGLLLFLADLAHRKRFALLALVDVENCDPRPFGRILAGLVAANTVRALYLAAADPEVADRRLFLAAKNDLVPNTHGLAYRIVAGPRIEWDAAPVHASLETALALAAPETCGPALAEAEAWLANTLFLRPCPASVVKEQARQDGIALRTLNRAKARLGVVAGPSDFHGPWIWRLPVPSTDRPAAPQTNTEK